MRPCEIGIWNELVEADGVMEYRMAGYRRRDVPTYMLANTKSLTAVEHRPTAQIDA